jgi:hypothetical protein
MKRSAIPVLFSALSLPLFMPQSAGAVDFDNDIKPILKANCYECHSEEAKKEKAGFVFDNKTRLKKDIGANMLIEPGDPGRSHFIYVISDPEAKHHMPPKKDLDKEDVDKLRQWIAEGAGLDKDAPKMVAKKEAPIFMTWINTEGKKVRAGFGGLQGDNVLLKMPDGKIVPYPMAKLAAESQAQAKEYATP